MSRPFRTFEFDPYFGPYVRSMDQIKLEILSVNFRDQKQYVGIPVTITFVGAVSSETELDRLFFSFREIWDLEDEFLGKRITREEFIGEFNQITSPWTGGFRFTGDLDADIREAGSPQNLVIRALGTIQDNPVLAFRAYSSLIAGVPFMSK